jgi:hypothetical protein
MGFFGHIPYMGSGYSRPQPRDSQGQPLASVAPLVAWPSVHKLPRRQCGHRIINYRVYKSGTA